MSHIYDLPLLLLFVGAIALWLQLSRGRDRAGIEATRLCRQHGLQLLDETVGLRGLRLRKLHGQWQWERSYGFDVSIDGDDREPSRLWMVGARLSGYNLPTIRTRRDDGSARQTAPLPLERPVGANDPAPPASSNVVPLRPRLRDDRSDRLH